MNGATNRRFDLSRTNSICPTPEESLLESVKKNQIDNIKTLIESNPNLLRHEYGYPYYKNILLIACSEDTTKPDTIQTLIDLGADLNGNEEYKPLHLAALNPNSEILEKVAENLRPGQINDKIDGNNALLYLIKNIEDENENDYTHHVEILLKNGLNVNEGDSKNISPILWAAKNKYKKIVGAILEQSITDIDLDSHKLRNNKTARDLIKENDLYKNPLPQKLKLPYDSTERLFVLLKESKQDEFVDAFNRCDNPASLVNKDDGSATLLQYACEKGLVNAVKCLLDNGVDVNSKSKNKKVPPIELVAENGFFQIFKLLIQKPELVISSKVICILIKNLDNAKFVSINHEECLKLLLSIIESKKIDINGEDNLKNTAIHYALRYADSETVQKLLKLGASLGSKNSFGVMPIEDIKPEILEQHLDSCIKFDIQNKNYEKQEFKVTFDYQNIVPPKRIRDTIKKLDEEEPEDPESQIVIKLDRSMNELGEEDLTPETDVVSYMSQAPEFQYLLKHPVIVSFLFMKWHRIRWLFYTNLIFYILFVLSLVVYIFTYYGNFSGDNDDNYNGFWANLSFFILNLTFLILILRELFQIAVSPRNYFHNFENLIEVILIVLTSLILFINSPSEDMRKQLSSIVILLAAFELVLMVGQHPKLSTNVVMLKTVSVTFFQLLLWYSLLIIVSSMNI